MLTEREIERINKKEKYHEILLKLMSLKMKTKLKTKGQLDDNAVLITANHLCIDDIPTMAQAIEKHTNLLVSDEDKKTFNGFILERNGVQWINRTDPESRKNAAKKAVDYLESGKNFAMYPEATWNLSPNLLMLKMNHGCIKIAQNSDKLIQPVVSSFTEKTRYSTIGDLYMPGNNSSESVEELRSIMANMVYEQIEKYYKENKGEEGIFKTNILGEDYYYEKREDLDPYYWEKHVERLYNAYPRARKSPDEVREYESQFIFEPKTDDYAFFIIFNSSIRYDDNGELKIKRISSEPNGYEGTHNDDIDYSKFFGYGYNEVKYKEKLKKITK